MVVERARPSRLIGPRVSKAKGTKQNAAEF